MASLIITPVRPSVGQGIIIEGVGFLPNAPVRMAIAEGGVVVKMITSAAGGFKTDKVIDWKPSRVGIFSIVAEDGTNRVEAGVQVWSQ